MEEGRIAFLYEDTAFAGVKKIADKVRKDINHVFGAKPVALKPSSDDWHSCLVSDERRADLPVIFGTAGHSPILDELDKKGLIRLDPIRGKSEVYSFSVIETPCDTASAALVIAGSDKRGTIYGLFHLSDILKVSPLTDWCDIMPDKMTELVLTESDDHISKEPSVKYRGFFINDEWPAFGSWAGKNFGGFNADMYEHVFELLLRLKGNYLWPAMWTAIFPDDGPGLKNAELADEMGVVMGMSHHEPCLRQGEEYKYLRGPESVYGDAWDFKKNREGIIRFWEDGLKRGGSFENVITVGMRGEFDSKIMGDDATLEDNIELLRDVLKTQNDLIRENVNEDLDKVPRMLALYKEVEPFFYGDEETEGLMGSPELEGVTLMLCDDNFGNLRTLPTDEMRDHKGGYGMYYHFDYHGWPVSYEWVNSTYLPKVWEQMTTAYEFGVRDLWIVNVGDIFTNEYPLSYFMALAYDQDKWGIGNLSSADDFTRDFVDRQFGTGFDDAARLVIAGLLKGYTRIANNRRLEAMNDDVYHPVNYGELEDLSLKIKDLMETADRVSTLCDETNAFTFFQLVGYPLISTLNLTRMWLATGENHYFASLGAGFGNKISAEVKTRLKLDRALKDKLHELHDGKWYGMGLSEHIGFKNWNEEECAFPVLYDFEPGNKARFTVTIPGTSQHTEGGEWTGKKLILPDLLAPSCSDARIILYSTGSKDARYEISCGAPWLKISDTKGTCMKDFYEVIYIKADRDMITEDTEASIFIKGDAGKTEVLVPIRMQDHTDLPAGTYVWCGYEERINGYRPFNYISIEAGHCAARNDTGAGRFVELPGHGRTLSAMKAFPVNAYFEPGKDAPSIDYLVYVDKEDEYEVTVYSSPCNPVSSEGGLCYGISSAPGNLAGKDRWDGEIEIVNTVPDDFAVGDHQEFWGRGVLDNIRKSSCVLILNKGLNTIRIFASSPGFVPEKIVINEAGESLPDSYLGPKETYRVK
ncbi:MAG: glycosyl hydrolase 115 family protein [Lachnospiraceae bacterium]|nr:glycosyl hydrolase 115 family protein [Lachnospiraceae bacterium]